MKNATIIFHPYQKGPIHQVSLKLFDHYSKKFIPLEWKTYLKYLGVFIDNNFAWKEHINYINEKISKTVGIIARLRHFVPLNTLQTIYKALLSSYLSYGIIAWGQVAKTHETNCFFCKSVPFVWCPLAIIQLTRFHIFCPLIFFPSTCSISYQLLFSCTIFQTIYHSRISFHVYSTLLIKYTLITLDPSQEVTTKLNFQDWIHKVSHFQDWGPKYGSVYLRVL